MEHKENRVVRRGVKRSHTTDEEVDTHLTIKAHSVAEAHAASVAVVDDQVRNPPLHPQMHTSFKRKMKRSRSMGEQDGASTEEGIGNGVYLDEPIGINDPIASVQSSPPIALYNVPFKSLTITEATYLAKGPTTPAPHPHRIPTSPKAAQHAQSTPSLEASPPSPVEDAQIILLGLNRELRPLPTDKIFKQRNVVLPKHLIEYVKGVSPSRGLPWHEVD
ncbi:Uncharacterized protein TCM_024676 [Theobroma cacao]|uniref:Uncharacterized protein n=1 Tax=Theobroma cacao TaxID=3641 RepID=A0A061F422_THECC|nr:Uncharacterized protein TCM_024676 [Theobroma cacao]